MARRRTHFEGLLILAVAAIVLVRPAIADETSRPANGREKPTASVEKGPAKAEKKPAARPDKPPRPDKGPVKPDKGPVKPDKASVKSDKGLARLSPAPITPEREAAALAFARENHPELASLLDGLKRNAPREYQAALVDLDRAVERLARTRERAPDRHAYDLAEWKITSRIRLLAARMAMSSDPVVEAELRSALRERLQLRVAAQQAERDRLQARAGKLEQQIDEMTSKADAIIERQFLELRKTLPAGKPPARPRPKKPADPLTP